MGNQSQVELTKNNCNDISLQLLQKRNFVFPRQTHQIQIQT